MNSSNRQQRQRVVQAFRSIASARATPGGPDADRVARVLRTPSGASRAKMPGGERGSPWPESVVSWWRRQLLPRLIGWAGGATRASRTTAWFGMSTPKSAPSGLGDRRISPPSIGTKRLIGRARLFSTSPWAGQSAAGHECRRGEMGQCEHGRSPGRRLAVRAVGAR